MRKSRWQWLLSMLFLVIQLARSEEENKTNNNATEAEKFFTKIYKENLKEMIELRNTSAEPCEDFYAHACGNYAKYMQSSKADDALPPFLYNKQDRMEFFMAQHPSFETLPGKLLSQLYEECKTHEGSSAVSWTQLLRQLPFPAEHKEHLSSWPFLPHQWRDQLSWIQLAAQLAAHGVPSLMHVYFAPGTIYVAAAPELRCPSLQGFMRSMSVVLKGRHPQVGRIVARELRVLCRGLRGDLEITPEPGPAPLQLDENFLEYFQHFFTALNFTEEQITTARKLALDVARIKDNWQVLRHTEPRIVYNYLLWQAQQQLKFTDCFQLTKEFERLLHVEYWQWHVLSPHLSRDVALALYQLHTTRFQKRRRSTLSQRDWYGYLLPQSVERKELQVARLLHSHAQHYLNLAEHVQYLQQFQFVNGSFYGNLLQLRRAQLLQSFESPYVDEEDERSPAYFLRHFLHFIILSLHRPMYHYYATQGLELWRESHLLEDTDGYYTALYCLERQTQQFDDHQLISIYETLSSHMVKQIFHFHRSFQATLRDYKFWLQGERFVFAEQFVLKFFGLDEHRVLFYAVAQQLCNRQDNIFGPTLNRGFMNLGEFQRAFNCEAHAPMNPPAKCMNNRCETDP